MTRNIPRIVIALALTAGAANAGAEGVLAQLYAARPPAGSSFVRVVNPHANPLQAQIAHGPVQEIGPATQATTYAIVKGNQPFDVRLDGKLAGTLQVAPDTFSTLVPRRDGGKLSFGVIDDSTGAQDALKAELRFYNLAADCAGGQLSVSPAGPVLFKDVESGGSAARAINPVSATLAAGCGAAASQPLALPALQPGDHYSLFLTGTPQAPVLRGQVSGTDPYSK